MKRQFSLGFFCLSLLFFLSACMSFGNHFPSQTGWIIKEETSKRDVLMVLGDPYAIGDSGGTPFWTYLYSNYKMGRGTFQKELKIYWNEEEVVKHYQFSSSFPEDLEDYSRYAKSSNPKASSLR